MSFVFEMIGLTFNTVNLFTGCYAHLDYSKKAGWYQEFFTAEGRRGDVKKFEDAGESADEIITDFEGELAPEEESFGSDIKWLQAILDFMANYYVRLAMQIIGFYSSYTTLN